jgi:hypothetical protein
MLLGNKKFDQGRGTPTGWGPPMDRTLGASIDLKKRQIYKYLLHKLQQLKLETACGGEFAGSQILRQMPGRQWPG